MKPILILLLLFILSELGYAQTTLKPYLGINYSNARYHFIDNELDKDSVIWKSHWKPFLRIGADITSPISKKWDFTYGFGVSWLGSQDYNMTYVGANFEIPPDLVMGYIELPLIFGYKLINNIYIYGGSTIGYNFRKNQNFFYIYENGVSVKTNNVWQLAANYGLRMNIHDVSFEFGAYHGLINLYNTGDIDPDKRAYLKMMSLQFKMAYIIRDKLVSQQ